MWNKPDGVLILHTYFFHYIKDNTLWARQEEIF